MRRALPLMLCCLIPLSVLAETKPDPKTVEFLRMIGGMYDGKLPMTRGKVTLVSKKFVEPNIIETTFRFVNDDPKENLATNGGFEHLIAQDVQVACAPPQPWAAISDGAEFRTRYEVEGRVEFRVLNRNTCHAEVRKAQAIIDACVGDAQCRADNLRAKQEQQKAMKVVKNFEPLSPKYPAKEFMEGITGDCTFVAAVDAKGNAQQVKIAKSTGNRNLDRSCMFAGLYSEYPPAKSPKDSKLRYMSADYSFGIDEQSRARALKEKAKRDAEAKAKRDAEAKAKP